MSEICSYFNTYLESAIPMVFSDIKMILFGYLFYLG